MEYSNNGCKPEPLKQNKHRQLEHVLFVVSQPSAQQPDADDALNDAGAAVGPASTKRTPSRLVIHLQLVEHSSIPAPLIERQQYGEHEGAHDG